MKTERNPQSGWWGSGEPWIWVNAGAVAISMVGVIGLLVLLLVNGFSHFWPRDIAAFSYQLPGQEEQSILGQVVGAEEVTAAQVRESGVAVDSTELLLVRHLVQTGNRDLTGTDFRWQLENFMGPVTLPEQAMVVERREWGNLYGFLRGLTEEGSELDLDPDRLWADFEQRVARVNELHEEIAELQHDAIGAINYRLERLRLRERAVAMGKFGDRADAETAAIAAERQSLDARYQQLQGRLGELNRQLQRDRFRVEVMDGSMVEYPVANVVRAYRPNLLGALGKAGIYQQRLWEFFTAEPREANTEGGIFPAIFGTILMVLLMTIFVTPFGVVAAVYLREYARQGLLTRTIRVAVNNLAGVPSIVYGVFGLGFFVYFVGAHIDRALYQEALPAPTFGTPGLMWASLTLALLTLPVVIVATEEGLARIPRSLREGSLALGATRFQTLCRIVLPAASPALMTGLILAVARAAGEVAPLMLVGVVKLAPTLPLDGNFPFLHLERKFMHLGFHIYDVGFQSPNVEAARPLVYATALLLVGVIAILNLSAVAVRNHLREKYKSLES